MSMDEATARLDELNEDMFVFLAWGEGVFHVGAISSSLCAF